MRTHLLSFLLFLATSTLLHSQTAPATEVYTTDIDHFWEAYDSVQVTTGSFERLQVLDRLFFKKGTPGLALVMEARRYTPQEYLDAIERYPLFWQSVRGNTMRAREIGQKLGTGIAQLRNVYPGLKPAPIYFTVGALRTPGTALKGSLLIGAELALADAQTNTTEFVERFKNLKGYFVTEPIKHIHFLNIHEYVHTQQNAEGGYDLLSQCVFEGVAEFVPTVALGQASPTPAVAFGAKNKAWVRSVFEREMFAPWEYRWVWNSDNNEFKTRDVGYYVGYAIAEGYYQRAKDKKQAIKELIELDYTSQQAVEQLVDQSGYFPKKCKKLRKAYEKGRPKVTGMVAFENGSKQIAASQTEITVQFSEPMDTRFRSTELGPLGMEARPEITDGRFGTDGLTFTYVVKLQAGKQYQFIVNEGFRNMIGVPMKPYFVEFWTK